MFDAEAVLKGEADLGEKMVVEKQKSTTKLSKTTAGGRTRGARSELGRRAGSQGWRWHGLCPGW